jgi:predicted transcriptional regulator
MNITTAESQVMELLWAKGPLGSEEIIQTLAPAQDWSEATIRTLLGRLVKKGAVAADPAEGRRYSYRPLVARNDYVLAESEGLIDRLFAGELAPMVAHFTKNKPLTPKDIQALKALINELGDADDDA